MIHEKQSLEDIRESERTSHTQVYLTDELYREGSWLSKPIKTVTDLFSYFHAYPQMKVLDLGCGIGRNCIAIAQNFKDIPCRIDCVDILDTAVKKLTENADRFGVSQNIHGIVKPIEDFPIPEDYYDWILAVSALEHVDSPASFIAKLIEIKNGLRKNGIVCLVLNSSIQEFDTKSGESLPPQFEINLPTNNLQILIDNIFDGWEIIKKTVNKQQYKIPRENTTTDLHTNVVTFVAKK